MNYKKEDMPREKLLKDGPDKLTNSELLAIILQSGVKGVNVFELSQNIMNNLTDIKDLLNYSYYDLMKIKGIKESKATKIIASIELSKRIFSYQRSKTILNEAQAIYDLVKLEFIEQKQEILLGLFLDSKCQLIFKKILGIGNMTGVGIDAKAIFAQALKCGAYAIILVHNHPSGRIEPSLADREMTKVICDGGKLLGINILDHIIIGDGSYYSFLEHHII